MASVASMSINRRSPRVSTIFPVLLHLSGHTEHVRLSESGEAVAQGVPEFGAETVAVLRAELGDVARFKGSAQVVAYAGLDVTVRESGRWQGRRKLSKRGSGALRRYLFLAALGSLRTRSASAFGASYRALEARGLRGYRALMAVMRKMLVVVYHLVRSGEQYVPTKVWSGTAILDAYHRRSFLSATTIGVVYLAHG
jgi:transposase